MRQFMDNRLNTCIDENTMPPANNEGLEVKSGRLSLLQQHKGKSLKVPVFIRVYKSCFEHYAVLYKDQRHSLQFGYISLKNCIVNKNTEKKNQVRVTLNDFEGTGVVFETNSAQEADIWLNALRPQILCSLPPNGSISPNLSPVIPRSPLMPTLAEETDEND